MYVGKSNKIPVRVIKTDLTQFSVKFLQNNEHKRRSLRPSNAPLYRVNTVRLKNNFIKVTRDKNRKKPELQ